MDLTDPRFGDIEHATDFGEGEPLVVVQRQNEALAIGEPVDRVGEEVSSLFLLEAAGGIDGCRVCDHLSHRTRFAFGWIQELVESHEPEVGDLAEMITERVERHVHRLGHLFFRRCALVAMLELGHRSLDLPRTAANRSRDPIECAQLVEDCTLDAVDGIRLELESALWLEFVDGVDQAKGAKRDEVRLVDVLRKPGADATRNELDQR